MPRFAFALCTICFSVFLTCGCGSGSGGEEIGAVIPEEDQPTEEEINAEPEIPGDNL